MQRVLERETHNDWQLINKKYTLQGIVREAVKMRSQLFYKKVNRVISLSRPLTC